MKFKSDIEVQAGLKDSSGAAGTSGQILSSNGTTVSWINADGGVASDVQNLVKAGVAINKGQAVYVTSAAGTNIVVGLASNTSEATSSKTLGLLDATVAINGMANVVQIGRLEGLNTSTATVGDPVWLGANGNLIYGLANKPYAPLHLVFIGIVTRVNANNGEIFINVQNGFELNEIHDVDLKTTIPVNGHILGYNGTLWVNKTIAGWLGYTPANDANVVHLTGNESITGNKSFSNSTANPAITVSNNNNGSFGIFLVNTLAGSGMYSVNSGSGGGISASNTSTGNGIYSGNGGTGTGIYSYNGSSGYGIFSLNSSTGTNVYLSNGASGKNLVLNNTTTNTGMPFTIQKIGVDKFTINDAGEAIGVKFIKSGGTSSQFLKADGSVDSSTYLTSLSGAVLTTTDQTVSGTKTFSSILKSGLLFINETGGFGNIAGFTQLGGTSDYFQVINGTNTKSTKFIHNGGRSLTMPASDGTLALTSQIPTVSGTTNYIPKFTGASAIGNSLIYDNGTNIGIGTTSPNYSAAGRTTVDVNGTSQAMLALSVGGVGKGFLFHTGTDLLISNEINGSIGFNANGDRRVTILPSGNVGIGTTSPSTALDVNGVISITAAAPYIQWKNTSNTRLGYIQHNATDLVMNADTGAIGFTNSGGERMRITSGGHLLVGTTTSLYGNSTRGNIELNGSASSLLALKINDTIGCYLYTSNVNSELYSTLPLTFAVNGAERMRITSSGNVGIGTTSPNQLLHIEKDQNSYTNLRVRNNNTGSSAYTMIGLNSSGNSWGMRMGSAAANSNRLDFVIDAFGSPVERMSITSGGNVGIGTSSPSAKFVVNDAVSTLSTVASFGTLNNSLGIKINSNGSPEIFSGAAVSPIYISQGTTKIVTISDNGNVGIGTSSPVSKLHIQGTGVGAWLTINRTDSGTNIVDFTQSGTRLGYFGYIGNDFYLQNATNSNTLFSTNNTERMRITSGGEVLIGTTSDVGDYKLQVNGRILATDSIYSNGDVIAYASSDIRLKDNILPIKNALEKVKKIGGYTFDWNNKQTTYEGHDVGVIAQEIEAVLPEVVTTRDNGYKAVKYEKLTALLIESIKEQQVQIERLELLINKLTK